MMDNKRYRPLVDKLFLIITIPVAALVLGLNALAFSKPSILFLKIPISLFVFWFFILPLFGYVELREQSVFIKYGLILKKEIPYKKIRSAEKGKGFYSESMMSLKNSLEHVTIKYNSFDVTTVSVVVNDAFITELKLRCSQG